MNQKIRLLLVIRSLDVGGAERQFIELVKNINHEKFILNVVTTYPGTLDNEIIDHNFTCLNKKNRYDFNYFLRFIKYVKNNKPDIVYSFMPASNVTMALVKFFSINKFKLIWGQFGSKPDFKKYAPIKKQMYFVQKLLEPLVDAVLSDGSRGIDFYKSLKMKLKKWKVINSGTNIKRFYKDENTRNIFRKKYNLKSSDIVIGVCSRLDPMKGYLILAEAAYKILNDFDNVYFFSIGYGDNSIILESNRILKNHSDRFIWLGKKLNPEKIMSGWDIYCSPSIFGEGFSNSIIEAMSCSLPVIATDVGDAIYQVSDCGIIIEPNSVDELYKAIKKIINSKLYADLGRKSRVRVEKKFSSIIMTKNTESFLRKLYNSKI